MMKIKGLTETHNPVNILPDAYPNSKYQSLKSNINFQKYDRIFHEPEN